MAIKKLYRSTTDQKISGIIGGMAEYLEVDSTILRVLWVLCTVFTGFVLGILAYVIVLVIIPRQP